MYPTIHAPADSRFVITKGVVPPGFDVSAYPVADLSGPSPSGAAPGALASGGLYASLPWLRVFGSPSDWVVDVRARSGGELLCRIVVHRSRSRVLPTHETWRVWRTRPGGSLDAWEAGIARVCAEARLRGRVLRVAVEVFDLQPEVRASCGSVLEMLGFRPSRAPWGYRETVVFDLGRAEDAAFASLHGTARRHIRGVAKHGVVIRPVTAPELTPRLEELVVETLARTRGRHVPRDWAALIEFGSHHPDLLRIAGLFSTTVEAPRGLLAFAVGLNHGDHVEYGTAASTRSREGARIPLGYALAWDLISWARSVGAKWFDFGGVTAGRHGSPDPLGGISDFKRYFSKRVVSVTDEWSFEPSATIGAVAHAISTAGARAGAFWRTLRS